MSLTGRCKALCERDACSVPSLPRGSGAFAVLHIDPAPQDVGVPHQAWMRRGASLAAACALSVVRSSSPTCRSVVLRAAIASADPSIDVSIVFSGSFPASTDRLALWNQYRGPKQCRKGRMFWRYRTIFGLSSGSGRTVSRPRRSVRHIREGGGLWEGRASRASAGTRRPFSPTRPLLARR
jgi:hypothetical protein